MSKKRTPKFYLIEPNMDGILGPYDSVESALKTGVEDIREIYGGDEDADWLLVSLVGNVELKLSFVVSEED